MKSFENLPDMAKERFELVPNLESGINRVEEDREFALIWNSFSIDHVYKTRPCQVSTIPNFKLASGLISLFVQKNSQLEEIFNM